MKNFWLKLASLFLALMMLVSMPAMFGGCSGEGDENTSEGSTDNSTYQSEYTDPSDGNVSPILLADLANYVLVRPEKISADLLEEINLLNQKLKTFAEISYKDDFYKEGVPAYSIGEYEILVGRTNRAETAEFLSKLKYYDYGYAQIGNKIVITGYSDEATINAIHKFIADVLGSKNSEDGVFYSAEYNIIEIYDYDIDAIYVDKEMIENYRIVYPKANSKAEKIAAQQIADTIAETSGIVLNVVSDDAEPWENEILIGATNRNTDAEITAMSEKLGDMEAVIKYDGKKINIFGLTSTTIFIAAGEFGSNFEGVVTEKLELALEPEYLCEYDDSILTAMSFNVLVSSKTAERNERVLTMIRNYFPDTIGLQEVDPVWLSTLNNGLKDQYAYVGEGRDGGSNGEYNPIFYKKEVFDLIDSGTRWLSDTPNVVSKVKESSLNRIYTYALLERKSDGTRIMIVNTHLDHTNAEARVKQAKVLVEFLKSVTDYPIILTGDFNSEKAESTYSTVLSGGVSNACDLADIKINSTAATYTNFGASSKRIDFIFVKPKNIAVVSYKVCNEKINGDYPSDHHPLFIEYTIVG